MHSLDNSTAPTREPTSTDRLSVVTRDDPRYPEMVVGYNQRWVGAPDAVVIPRTSGQVQRAVRDAVTAGKRVSVRSGGHCYADFVYNPDVDVVIDMSAMNGISWDAERGAVCVEPGAQLGQLYQTLYREWGVTLPAGVCLSVGVGGHVSGGGFGFLSRKHGLVADYLEAVEVVIYDGSAVRTIVASRDPEDPAYDLWWAVTGGGGGTFGVVTRFWFRRPGERGGGPATSLPAPPAAVLLGVAGWPWSLVDEATFVRVMTNYAGWHVANSAPGTPAVDLCSVFFGRSSSGLAILTQVDAGAGGLLSEFNAALVAGTGLTVPPMVRKLGWLTSTKVVGSSGTLLHDPTLRSALKTAWLRKGLEPDQLASVYRSLTTAGPGVPNGIFQLLSMGGQISAVAPDATASVHRSSVMFAEFETFWTSPADDEANIAWLRELYGGAFSATGGYPVPSDQADGCYISNPDPDITDPAYNKSGVQWPALYFGANYPRLQRAKARWDPTDFFRHSQSVRLP